MQARRVPAPARDDALAEDAARGGPSRRGALTCGVILPAGTPHAGPSVAEAGGSAAGVGTAGPQAHRGHCDL